MLKHSTNLSVEKLVFMLQTIHWSPNDFGADNGLPGASMRRAASNRIQVSFMSGQTEIPFIGKNCIYMNEIMLIKCSTSFTGNLKSQPETFSPVLLYKLPFWSGMSDTTQTWENQKIPVYVYHGLPLSALIQKTCASSCWNI